MATCRACGAALGLRARLPAALRPPVLQHRRRLSGGEEGRPRTPLAQAAWDYQQEAKARLAEDGGINTETAFEILANHRIRQAMVTPRPHTSAPNFCQTLCPGQPASAQPAPGPVRQAEGQFQTLCPAAVPRL